MPFYEINPDAYLRQGDVVAGFPVATPASDERDPATRRSGWIVKAAVQDFLVVLSPCCNLDKKTLLLAPLSRLPSSMLLNPYLSADFTRANVPMQFEHSVAPHVLESLRKSQPEETERRLQSPAGFHFRAGFIYAPHPSLPQYEPLQKGKPSGLTVGHYFLDFTQVFRFDCAFVTVDAPVPAGTKIAQLDVFTRRAFREKLAFFFGKGTEDDEAALSVLG